MIEKEREGEMLRWKARTRRGVALNLVISTALMSTIASPAFGQERGLLGDDIVVTAQKREEAAQDVGVTLNAISGDALDQLQVRTAEDLASYVPNLSVRKTKGENYPTITIRGVGLATGDVNYGTSTSSTAVHVDEVYFGSPAMLGMQLFDIERVEVLKGPQGTLYGRNSTAGSVNYTSRRPTADFEGQVSGGWNDQSQFTTFGHLSGPISDSLSARLAYSLDKGDSYQKDLTGRRWNGPDRLALRGSLAFSPHADVDVHLTGTFASDTSGIGRYHVRGISENVWVADGNLRANQSSKLYGVTSKVTIGLPAGFDLTSVSSYNRIKSTLPDEPDGEAITLQEGIYKDTVEQVSQEARLAYNSERTSSVLGLYYFHEQVRATRALDFFAFAYPADDFRPGVRYDSRQVTDAYALFGQVEYAVANRLRAIVGARYSYERKRFRVSNLFNNFLGGLLGATDRDPATGYLYRNLREADSKGWGDLSGKVALNYEPSDELLIYGSVSNGFKSGGYLGSSTITRAAVRTPGRPEDLTAYEIGLKSRLADRKIRLNAAAFYYDYRDLQAESITFDGIVPFQTLVNVQKVTIKGFDLDVSVFPFDGLELSIGIGYVDGVHDRFVTGAGDFSGSRILNAPKWSINDLISYEVARSNRGVLTLIFAHEFNSSIDFNFNDRSLGSKSYHLVDLRVSYKHLRNGVSASFWVKNLTNEKVLVHAFDRGDGKISELYQQPRRAGVELSIPF